MPAILCQICQKVPALSHLTEVRPDGSILELHICPLCIKARALDLHNEPPPLAELLGLAAGAAAVPAASTSRRGRSRRGDPTCPACGLAWSGFQDGNKFGCASCADAFGARLRKLVSSLHGVDEHQGRRPGETTPPEAVRLRRRIALEQELARSVAVEDYAAAARLRDQLRELDAEGA